MTRALNTKKGQAAYARRKAIVEPALGQMKVAQNARQLRGRALGNAHGEWTMEALCHNVRKLRSRGFHPVPAEAFS